MRDQRFAPKFFLHMRVGFLPRKGEITGAESSAAEDLSFPDWCKHVGHRPESPDVCTI